MSNKNNNNNTLPSEQQVRQAYRIPEDRCPHVQKFVNNNNNNNINPKNTPVGGNVKKNNNNNKNETKIFDKDCSIKNDITCLNSYNMQSLPAASKWPTERLSKCFVGSEPPPTLSKEELEQQKPSGIPNLGNTCYANSVLQCLARVGMDWSRGDCEEDSSSSNGEDELVLKHTPRFLDLFLSAWTEVVSSSSVNNNKNNANNNEDAAIARNDQEEELSSQQRHHQEQLDDLQATNNLRVFLSKLRSVHGNKVSLADVMKSLDVNVYEQQDAQEFYVLLMYKIEQNLNQFQVLQNATTKKEKQLLMEAFSSSKSADPLPFQHPGDLKNEIRDNLVSVAINSLTCHNCDRKLDRGETLGFGGIPLHPSPSLEHAIKRFCQAETDPRNTFHCETCDEKKAQFSTQYSFRKFSPIVCFQFLRFKYEPRTGQRIKVRDRIRIPEYLDLHELCAVPKPTNNNNTTTSKKKKSPQRRGRKADNNNNNSFSEDTPPPNVDLPAQSTSSSSTRFVYRLQAAVLHKGATATRGHYISIVRGQDAKDNSDSTWWRCDDCEVKKIDKSLFVKPGTETNNNKSSDEQQKAPPPGAVVAETGGGRKAKVNAKKQLESEFNHAKKLIQDVAGINNEDAAAADDVTENNHEQNNQSTNNNEQHFASDELAWTSDEVFMVWYELVERRVDEDDDRQQQAEVLNIDDEDDNRSKNNKASPKKTGNNKKNAKNTNDDNDDSHLFTTPLQFWPHLLKQSRITAAEAAQLQQQYDQKLQRAQSVFEAWRSAALWLAKPGKDNEECNWATNHAYYCSNKKSSHHQNFFVIPEEWLQQLRAAAVRDGDFSEEDTTVDISSPDVLFLDSAFNRNGIVCAEHSTHNVISSSSKKGQQQQQQLIKPLSPFRLVSDDFFQCLVDLILAIRPTASLRTFTLPYLSGNKNNSNNNNSPSSSICFDCVRQRIDDISSNREAEQRLEKMRQTAKKIEKEKPETVARKTSLGKSEDAADEQEMMDLLLDSDAARTSASSTTPSSSSSSAAPHFISKKSYDIFMNAKNKTANLSELLEGVDLVENLICKHNNLRPGSACQHVPAAVYRYLKEEFRCFASVELPLWRLPSSSTANSPSVSSGNKNKKNNNNKKKQQQQKQTEDGTDIDDEQENENEQDATNGIILSPDACRECYEDNQLQTATAASIKLQKATENKELKEFLKYPEQQTHKILSDHKKLKEAITKHRNKWKADEKVRIQELLDEKKREEEKKAKFAQSAINVKIVKGGGRGRGRGRGRGAAASQQEVVDVDAEEDESPTTQKDSPVQQDASPAVSKTNPDLEERPPEPLIRKYSLIPYEFARDWQNYITSDSNSKKSATAVSADGEEETNSDNNKSENPRPLIERYHLRCRQHPGLSNINIDDLKDFARFAEETKSSRSINKNNDDIILHKYQAVVVPTEFLKNKIFNCDIPKENQHYPPFSNISFEEYRQNHLVSLMSIDEIFSIEPAPCDKCIAARNESLQTSQKHFDKADITCVAMNVQTKRKQREKVEMILQEISSDMTTVQLYERALEGLFHVSRNRPDDESKFFIKKKGTSNPIKKDQDLTLSDCGITRTGTELRFEMMLDGQFVKMSDKDLEEEEMQKAIRASLEIEKEQEQEQFAALEQYAQQQEHNQGQQNSGSSKNKKGGRQKGVVVSLNSDAGRNAFESSRLNNNSSNNNNNSNGRGGRGGGNNNNSNAEIPCPTCTYLNKPRSVKCEICESPL